MSWEFLIDVSQGDVRRVGRQKSSSKTRSSKFKTSIFNRLDDAKFSSFVNHILQNHVYNIKGMLHKGFRKRLIFFGNNHIFRGIKHILKCSVKNDMVRNFFIAFFPRIIDIQ